MSIGKEILNSCLAALVTFVFLVGGIFLWGKGCNHSDTPDSPAGEYYWEGSSVGQLESIVKIHEDGTWTKQFTRQEKPFQSQNSEIWMEPGKLKL